ncbi:hypothetical protein QYF36_013757 [Acer negundo]|nr:hypothetical protein QYF36_013757 [Acer negundo]
MQGVDSAAGGRSDDNLVKRKLHNNRVASLIGNEYTDKDNLFRNSRDMKKVLGGKAFLIKEKREWIRKSKVKPRWSPSNRAAEPSQEVPRPEKIAQVKGAAESRVCLRPNRKLAKARQTFLPPRSHPMRTRATDNAFQLDRENPRWSRLRPESSQTLLSSYTGEMKSNKLALLFASSEVEFQSGSFDSPCPPRWPCGQVPLYFDIRD